MARLTRWDPFKELETLQNEVFGGDPFRSISTSVSAPIADVYTEDNELVQEIHLPNFNEDEVDIRIENGVLEVRAEHTDSKKDKEGDRRYITRESSHSFYRSFALPEHYKEDEIEAHFDEGVLKIITPLEQAPEPKKISIKSSKKK